MSYLLDSNIIIDFQKAKEPGSTYFLKATEDSSSISVISYAEVAIGIKNYPNALYKMKIFDDLINNFGIEILGINKKEVVVFVDLKLQLKHNLIPDFDLLIAAAAIANNFTLVTGNTKHFSRIPNLKLYSPKSA